MSVVYFISDGTYVKIGKTDYDAETRLKELQTGNPNKLKLIYKVEVPEKCAYRTETMFHKYFSKYKLRGEWFAIAHIQNSELQKIFDDYCITNNVDINNVVKKKRKKKINPFHCTAEEFEEYMKYHKDEWERYKRQSEELYVSMFGDETNE